MKMSVSEARRAIHNCEIGDYAFGEVANFTYLVSDLNNRNQKSMRAIYYTE